MAEQPFLYATMCGSRGGGGGGQGVRNALSESAEAVDNLLLGLISPATGPGFGVLSVNYLDLD